MKLRVLDLFAGIAGFSLGLHRAGGYRTVGFCEMKPHAQAVLAKNFRGIPCHDDVTTYPFKEGEADVITAGFPCQDISFAGDGAGLAGARSGLYREVIRALRVVRPLYAILENVAALLSRGLDVVLGDMAEIGYDAEWHCIPASAVGAPHRRDRIWIIADARSEQHEGGRAPFSGSLASQLAAANSDCQANGQQCAHAEDRRDGTVTIHGLADAASERRGEARRLRHHQSEEWLAGSGEEMADTERFRQSGSRQPFVACNPTDNGERQTSYAVHGRIGNQWATEPDVGRVAHGVPNRVDRLAELGNAVVPAIPEIIGRAILASRAA